MSTIEGWLLSYLLNSLWQVPIFFVIGWLAAQALKPLGPAAEHRLWIGVLLSQTLVPAASTLPSGWISKLYVCLGELLSFFTSAPRPADSQVSVAMGTGAGIAALHIPPALLITIAIAYALATAWFAGRFFWRCFHLRTLRRESTPIALTGEAAGYWAQCLQDFAIGKVALATSPRIRGPVTIGLTRKLLLLPATMEEGLPQADLRTVIAHEFAHMRRNDFLKNLIYEFLALPVSYHPALWLTRERIMESREAICDQIAAPVATSSVSTLIEARQQYARSLLRLASLLVTGTPIRTPHAIGILDAHAFERRLMQLTQQPTHVRPSRRFGLVAACTVLGLATCASALALRLSVDATPGSADKKASQPSDHLTVSSAEMAGNVVTRVMPKYPQEAKEQKIQGTVVLNAVIGKGGSIENLTVASGPKELQQSALDAVSQWSYKPYLHNGDPVEVETTINVIYSLGK